MVEYPRADLPGDGSGFPPKDSVARPSSSAAALGQLAEPDPVHPPIKHDLGMLTITDIAAENTGAAFPQDRHTGSPDGAHLGGR